MYVRVWLCSRCSVLYIKYACGIEAIKEKVFRERSVDFASTTEHETSKETKNDE